MCGSPIPVVVQSKAWVCCRSFAGVTGSNPGDGIDFRSLVFVLFCVVNGLCDRLLTPSEESCRVLCDELYNVWKPQP